MLSIIIPTLNEEKNLPNLLRSIKEQGFSNPEELEIIVADAGSKDKTIEIARKFGCEVVKGGLPAKGRNEGAKAAKGDLLLFLDADVVLAKNCLAKALEEFEKRNLLVAGCLLEDSSQKVANFILQRFFNPAICLLENVLPHSNGFILIKKNLHQKIGGFDEEIKLAEDDWYVRESGGQAKFGILRKAKISISLRRFEQDGWLKTTFKCLLSELHLVFFGPIKSNFIFYPLGHYQDSKSKKSGPKIFELILGSPILIIWLLTTFFAFLLGNLKNFFTQKNLKNKLKRFKIR